MEQLKRILAGLSIRQRLMILLVVGLTGAGLTTLFQWKKESDFRRLYTGLVADDTAAVVQKLKESSTEYRLADNGNTVLVPSGKVAEMRLELAAAGLPKTGRVGFEIFDKNNLGATEFVEHINYQRAVEGELERSVMAVAEVEQARVHVTFAKSSVFVTSREPAKASVMVKLKSGARLADRNVTALRHLVSSAVEGLAPDSVSILDMQGNLLSQPRRSPDEEASEAVLEYRQKVERDLLLKINTTLDPLLGKDHYRANVLVDCDRSSGEQSEETLDPTKSVVVSAQNTEETVGGAGSASGVPGTASNLPRPTSRPGSSGSSTTRRTETIAYQTSRTMRTMKLPQGSIKRVSVAVLVDQGVRWEGTGAAARRILAPPPPETLKAVTEVIAAVAGISKERGDQLTVETLPFESTLKTPPPPAPPVTVVPGAPVSGGRPGSWQELLKDRRVLIGAAAALVLLLLAGGVVFFLKRKKRAKATVSQGKALPGGATVKAVEASSDPVAELEARMAEQEAKQLEADAAALASIRVPVVTTKKTDVLAKQLRENVKKDASVSAKVLQTWLHDNN
jgi:flagellar M-ring protein FliF